MMLKKSSQGDSLRFIKDYSIPKNLHWAKPVPAFAKGLAAEEQLLKEIEATEIPKESATLFKSFVNNWQGKDMPLGKVWLNEQLSHLTVSERPIAQLMFLAAFAPYSVTEKDIINFLKIKPADKELITFCYWAIQTLTNRISGWLTQSFNNRKEIRV